MAPGKNSCVENQFPLVLDEKGATLLAWGYAGLGRVGISIETKRQGGCRVKILWWEKYRRGHNFEYEVPIFSDFDLESPWKMQNDHWVCAREQLWAMREGLA